MLYRVALLKQRNLKNRQVHGRLQQFENTNAVTWEEHGKFWGQHRVELLDELRQKVKTIDVQLVSRFGASPVGRKAKSFVSYLFSRAARPGLHQSRGVVSKDPSVQGHHSKAADCKIIRRLARRVKRSQWFGTLFALLSPCPPTLVCTVLRYRRK